MNYEKALGIINKAIESNSKALYLSSAIDIKDKLSSADLQKLLSSIKKVVELETLFLSDNKLTDISFLKELNYLTSLNLQNNEIEDIEVLKDFKNLKRLYLSGNKLLETKFRRRYLEENFKNAQAIIQQYFDWKEAKKNNTLTPLNEAKIVLIGQGNVGKSSLRISLKNGKCPIKQKKTEGLEVVEWDLKATNERTIKFHIWDFGGQEIYHTTHQYFFDSECLYLLVTDYSGRVEWRTNRLGYWLKTIQLLAKEENSENKPVVIIIGNKADERGDYKVSEEAISNEIEKAKEKYSDLDIIGFFPISCHEGENIYSTSEPNGKILIDAIKEQLSKIGVDREIPQKYVDYKEEIAKSGKDFIKVDEFSNYCPYKTDLMRIIFHSTGIITAFCENHKIKSDKLKELIVFNSEWITKGIYKVLSANHLLEINNGRAKKEELRGLLDENKYPSLDDVTEMMKEFYLCASKLIYDYKGNQIEEFFFPKFFTNKTPSFVKSFKNEDLKNRIEYKYSYHFISDNIISFFIIKASEVFKNTDFWKDGSLIIEEDTIAVIESDEELNEINIIAKGENADSLLCRVKDIFEDIHKLNFIPKPNEGIETLRKKEDLLQNEILSLKKQIKDLHELLGDKVKEKGVVNIMNQQFNSPNSQIGAQGNDSTVKENTFNQQNNSQIIDLKSLIKELDNLLTILNKRATTAEEGKAVAKVEQAKEAAEENDENKVVKYLKEGGKFVLETAKDIGAKVLTDIIEKQMIGS